MLYIKNVHALTQNGDLAPIELVIREGKIFAKGTDLSALVNADAQVIDGKGNFIAPGLVDVHVHLREPGQTEKETILTGTKAAARGGFTTVCAMPNLKPTPDSVENFEQVKAIIDRDAVVHVKQYATITENLNSETTLSDQAALLAAGAFAFTNDGVGVQTAGTMYQAMLLAAANGASIVAHTEDNSLLYGGVMHAGERAEQLGLPGMLALTESTQIARDVLLAEKAGCHYHVCHVSSKESVRVIRDAKLAGINVTAEVSPHHLLLNDMDIPGDDATFKMNPPLRSREDQIALIEGLLDGTIDCIATDHAPHTQAEKQGGFVGAPFGIVGSETAFQLLYTNFVKSGIFSLGDLIYWLSTAPAEIFDLPAGSLEIGAVADLALFDLNDTREIRAEDFLSKSSNTPFIGKQVQGTTRYTIVEGQIVYKGVSE